LHFEKLKSPRHSEDLHLRHFFVIGHFRIVCILERRQRLGFSSFDDQIYVNGNMNVITGLTHWKHFLGILFFLRHPTGTRLPWMSHMIDTELYGMKPAGHHLTSLLFHIVNTLLLFPFAEKSPPGHYGKALGELASWIHPVHVESDPHGFPKEKTF